MLGLELLQLAKKLVVLLVRYYRRVEDVILVRGFVKGGPQL